MFESIYYCWYAKNIYDGTHLKISEIIEVKVEFLDENHMSSCVLIGRTIQFINNEHLFKTEKEAVRKAIVSIKRLYSYCYNEKGQKPKNLSLFLFKVNEFNQILFEKYNSIYPELFI